MLLKISLLIISILFFCLFLPLIAQGASLDVVINEIAWMGTENSANDEWIELYNNTGSSINLEGWILKAGDGTPEINLTGTIRSKSFYLLERTDDDTVSGVSADLIYKGALKNNGEDLKLYDNSGNLIDEVNCEEGWFAGDNSTKRTMERIDPLISGNNPSSWQTSQNPGGTPKAQNSFQPVEDGPLLVEEQGIAEAPQPPPVEPISYPAGVVFSEILPSPDGPDSENEWIEIFNQNSFEVNLSGWQIKDSQGKITIHTFPIGTKILANGYLVLLRPETKITLNNSGDELNLIQPNGEIIDSVAYQKASQNQSYNRTEPGWAWSSTLTPGEANIIPRSQPKKPSSLLKALETKEEKSEDGFLFAEKETAGVGEKISKSSLPVFLIAFVVALFSGIIILILKKKAIPKLPSPPNL